MSNIDPGPTGRNTWARRNDNVPPPEDPLVTITEWSDDWSYSVSGECLRFLMQDSSDFLSEWEQGFCRSVLSRKSWSSKQITIIDRICRRAMSKNFFFKVPRSYLGVNR